MKDSSSLLVAFIGGVFVWEPSLPFVNLIPMGIAAKVVREAIASCSEAKEI